VNIELTYLHAVNLAMQQNRVPVIRGLRIQNPAGHARAQVTVTVTPEPPFAPPVTASIGTLAANEEKVVDTLRLTLQPNFFAAMTEGTAGHLGVAVTADDGSRDQHDFPIEVLAYDQWCGSGILPELLASFATPNHPAIAPILRRATDWMEKWTGRSALDEYQARNVNRVRQQMAALYAALSEQNIAYAPVPASFGAPGQRIRLPDTVLAQKLGNCIELSLLYASCLEAAGIHPLIVLIKGHAFAGGWLIPDTFPDSITDDAAFLTKRIADGVNEILVLEATALASGGKIDFDQSVQMGQSHLVDGASFHYALDVKRCRFAGIRPLPQRIQNGGQWLIHEDASDIALAAAAPQTVTPYDLPQTAADTTPTKQMLWERKLLDLSLRNNLLNIRITKNTLQFISANLSEVEDALADGAEFRVLPRPSDWDNPLYEFGLHRSLEPADPIVELIKSELTQYRFRAYLPEEQLPIALTHLYRASRLAIEESGANTLYIALGLLKWFESPNSERPRYAPILLLPVEIIRKTSAKGYVIRSRDEEPFLNITLLEMLRQNFNLTIPGLDPLPRDQSGLDVKKIYTLFRHGVKNQRRWDVEEHAMLGLFSFNTFIMWNDIHAHAEELARNPAVASLMSGKLEWQPSETASDASEIDRTSSPADILLPVSADSSQLEAIHEALKGMSFILHGPPGTGKSQTITNIIANALYRGKRILFVAEKMAALSVVEERLRKIGLGPFCLELHSNKVQKSTVLAQLKETTEVVWHQSPIQFEQEAKRLYELRHQLNAYVQALHRKHAFGLTLYEAVPLYLNIGGERLFDFPSTQLDGLSSETLGEWRDAVETLASVGRACGHPHGHPLEGIGTADYSASLQTSAETAIKDWLRHLQAATPHMDFLAKVTGIAISRDTAKEEIEAARHLCDVLLALPACTPADSLFSLDAQALLSEWDAQEQKGFLSRWLGQRRLRKHIAQHLTSVAGTLDVRGILACLADLNATLRSLVQEVPHLKTATRHLALQLAAGTGAFRDLYGTSAATFGSWWLTLQKAAENAKATLALEKDVPATLRNAEAQAQIWLDHVDRLKDWSRWILARNRLNALGIGFVADLYKEQNIPADALMDAFKKSFYHAVIVYAISQDRALEMFNGRLFNDVIEKYQAMTAQFEQLARQELCAKLSANIPSFTIEATQNSEVGILQRNIRNNGRGTSIRKLFDHIPTLLPRMCPCMLMSPMSVAQYIDVSAEPFDLVIFDEASQMPTSEAVGALARGKNVVIVGDPKQMPPTNFFASQTADEEMSDLEDMESVLDDCLALSIPSKYLLWHYRSRHESLIAFSNAEYYDNALYTFPSPDNIASKVAFVPVPGCYDKGKSRTNTAEAQAIAGEIERRLSDPELRQHSIGVVTFSSVQQTLVEDLIGELFVKRPDLEQAALDRAEPLFIKNLENVQGDERDVILFSICYGPDKAGHVSMNFGPLNRKGGERRLNVAVSRARQEMAVFATLQPEQIDLNRTAAAGVAGLRRFLEYAKRRAVSASAPGHSASTDGASLTGVIADELRRRGHRVHTHIGTSRYRIDIGIVDPCNPARYKLGILCDGETYARAKTARDREIVQRETLRRLGWPLCRVWTMDWIEDPQSVLQTIEDALSRKAPPSPPPAEPSPAPAVAPPAAPPLDPPAHASPVKDRCKRDNPQDIPVEEIVAVIREHLEQQVSLPEDELLRLTARTFGYARLGTKVEAAMRNGLAQAKRANHLRMENGRASLPPAPALRAGQAVIEFIVGLLLLLIVITGMIHVANMGRASLALHAILRGEAGKEAMNDGMIGTSPPHISDWSAGADKIRYTVDDTAEHSSALGISQALTEYSVQTPGDWTYVADSRLPASAIQLNNASMQLLSFAHEEGTVFVDLSSVIRQLIYNKEKVVIKEEVWMPIMGGLY
jgi:very-short-patch-repair endonuclease